MYIYYVLILKIKFKTFEGKWWEGSDMLQRVLGPVHQRLYQGDTSHRIALTSYFVHSFVHPIHIHIHMPGSHSLDSIKISRSTPKVMWVAFEWHGWSGNWLQVWHWWGPRSRFLKQQSSTNWRMPVVSALVDPIQGIWGEQGWAYGYKFPKLLSTGIVHQTSDGQRTDAS